MLDSARLDDTEFEADPLFVDSLREAKWILLMWFICLIWTLTVCLSLGYPDSVTPETFPIVFGIPAWVVFGIVLPWGLANIATVVFCLAYMRDADLGPDMGTAGGEATQEDSHV